MIDKYELGNVEDLDSRGFAEAEHRARLPTTLTLQEVAKVTTMHVLKGYFLLLAVCPLQYMEHT